MVGAPVELTVAGVLWTSPGPEPGTPVDAALESDTERWLDARRWCVVPVPVVTVPVEFAVAGVLWTSPGPEPELMDESLDWANAGIATSTPETAIM